jgi:hypothetical protein
MAMPAVERQGSLLSLHFPNLWLSGRRTMKQNDTYVPVQPVHLRTAVIMRLYIMVPCAQLLFHPKL